MFDRKLKKLLSDLEITQEQYENFLYGKNMLATTLEVASISSRLLIKRNSDLNKIYVKNIIALYIQIENFIKHSGLILELDESYNDEESIFTESIVSMLRFDSYYSPFTLEEEDKFNLCNTIGVMCVNFSMAIWKDFEKNEYDVPNMAVKFSTLPNTPEVISFTIFMYELLVYLLNYIDRHDDAFLNNSLRKVFYLEEKVEPVEHIKTNVKESIIDGDEIKELKTETKIIDL